MPGRRGGGGEITARTKVPVVRPRRRNIDVETQARRRLGGGGSGWEDCGSTVCEGLGDLAESSRFVAGASRDMAWCWHVARAAGRFWGRFTAMRH